LFNSKQRQHQQELTARIISHQLTRKGLKHLHWQNQMQIKRSSFWHLVDLITKRKSYSQNRELLTILILCWMKRWTKSLMETSGYSKSRTISVRFIWRKVAVSSKRKDLMYIRKLYSIASTQWVKLSRLCMTLNSARNGTRVDWSSERFFPLVFLNVKSII